MHPFHINYPAEVKTNHFFNEDDIQYVFSFPNNLGASVVRNKFSYGNEHGEGFYELAVLKNGWIDYTTPVTENVIGWLSEEQVGRILLIISNLPQVSLNDLPEEEEEDDTAMFHYGEEDEE